MQNPTRVVVLNDGTTYSDVSGAKICLIPSDVEDVDFDEVVEDAYEEGGIELSELVRSLVSLHIIMSDFLAGLGNETKQSEV